LGKKIAIGRSRKQWQFANTENSDLRLFNTMQKLKDKD